MLVGFGEVLSRVWVLVFRLWLVRVMLVLVVSVLVFSWLFGDSVVVVRNVLVGMCVSVCIRFYIEFMLGILLVKNLVIVSVVEVFSIYYDLVVCRVGGRLI